MGSETQEEEAHLEGETEQEPVWVSEPRATPERYFKIICLLVVDWHGWK